MNKRRFLRDGVLDDMITDLHLKRDQLTLDESSQHQLQLYVTLHTMFETSKVVLERLEEVLDQHRLHHDNEEITLPIADAAMHLQTGIRTVHNSLMEENEDDPDTSDLMDEFENAQRELHLYPDKNES